MSPGPLQILIVCAVIVLIFGPHRIARMARSLGRGAYDFIDELGSSRKDEDEKHPELENTKQDNDKDRDSY